MTYSCSRLLALAMPPASEPLTLSEIKLHLRVDGTSEDTLITNLGIAARMAAEDYLNRSLITQSWKLVFDDYASSQVLLPRGPVVSITSVKSIARDGTQTVISSSVYYLNAAKYALIFDSDILGHQVEIMYVAGYGSAAAVPQPIKQGMLSHIAVMFEAREQGASLPADAIALYRAFREVRL